VPAKVTYCPLLFFKVCWQHVVFYYDGFGFHVIRFPYVDLVYPCVSCVVQESYHARHARIHEVNIRKTNNMESEPIIIKYDMLPTYFEK